jgi:DNA polymerase-1
VQGTPPGRPALFLIDGYALIYRAFFALLSRPLTTARGENTSAAWGVVNFLLRLQSRYSPDYLAWVHDSGLSFRHEVYPEYKATREKLTDELQSDFDRGIARIEQLLTAYRIPLITVNGFEADDVIGTLAQQGVENGVHVVIVSGDKDFQQLVRHGVSLLNPGRGGPAGVDEQWVGLENATERLGVPPEFVTDYLSLVGDTSDNVPGVPGIGDKTARELVQQFGGLESILSAASSLSRKRPREALMAHADKARISKQLVTIRHDLPITLDLEALRVHAPDVDELRRLFLELEFTTLLRELDIGSDRAVDPIPIHCEVVDDVEALSAVVANARQRGRFAVSIEAIGDSMTGEGVDPLRSRLIGISIALAPGESYYLPLAHRDYSALQGDLLPQVRQTVGSVSESPVDSSTDVGEPGAIQPMPSRSESLTESVVARTLAQKHQTPRNLPSLLSEEMRPLRDLVADPNLAKVAHNTKYIVLALRRSGLTVSPFAFDTMLASYVLDPGRRSHGLDLLALEFLNHPMLNPEEHRKDVRSQLPLDAVPIEAPRDYVCEEADIALRLSEVFAAQLESHGLSTLFRDVEMPLVEVLANMEQTGVSIDVQWFHSLKERFQRERRRVELEIYRTAGEEFNINSNPQLRAILFDKLQLPIKKKTSTGPSTDASVLQELADEGHVLPSLLMEYRELAKLESTYLDTLPALVHPDDRRLHTSYNQTVAATGRLSSSDPNLQNIPVRRELGRDIRRGFVARDGWRFLVADYSQIELRLLAHMSRDPAFVEAFSSGGDIHRQTAAVIFGIPAGEVTSEMRARAKTINFATIYGQGSVALARQLKISIAEAKDFIHTYFERFHGVREYLDSQIAFAREHGYVETIFKRRRYVPELRERSYNIRAFGERVATNAPIQGSAADLIKLAMIRIFNRMQRDGLRSAMILQVHDELVFDVTIDELPAVGELVRYEMEHAAILSVPLVVDLGVGRNWLEAKA